jgi:hypothetical protein
VGILYGGKGEYGKRLRSVHGGQVESNPRETETRLTPGVWRVLRFRLRPRLAFRVSFYSRR